MKTRTYSQEGSTPEKVQFSTQTGLWQSQQEPEVYDEISGVDALTYSDPWTPPKPSGCRSVQLLPNEGWCFLPPVNVAETSPHKTIYSPLPHQGSTSTFFPSCPTNEIKSKYNPGFNTRDRSKKHEMTVYADQIENKSRTYNGWSFGSLCFYKPRDSYCQFLSLSHPSFDLSPAMALPVQFTAPLVKRHLHVTLENQVFSSESCTRTEEQRARLKQDKPQH